MTYNQALMVIRNPDAYSRDKVRAAALDVISTIGAKAEDVYQAQSLL